jgi:hypothetical protein
MKTILIAALTAGLIASGAAATPGRGGDKGAVMGAQARARHGPDPMAKPPEDVGSAEDPAAPVGSPAASPGHGPAPVGGITRPLPQPAGSPQ